ncbi:MAG TPA: sulfate ABC transporter substrate-binding protein [Solirubrobacteraceae bacterium]|jgi:sulfate transport system substrate-binding protein
MSLGKTHIALLAAFAALVLAACGGADDTKDNASSSDGGGGGTSLSLVAYSTPQVVYDEIIPEFKKTAEGKNVDFKTSFGASGDQSRAVEGGLKADYVSFSTEGDMTRLVEAGLVGDDWQSTPSKGLVTTSVVAFVVRKGNPKNIKTWDDLVKPGVEVLTPNPFSSGAAKWNLLAALGANDLDYVSKLINDHVKVQDKSGREALQNFLSGSGDVLLSYEYEAITAQKKGEEVDYVIPDDTIKIDINAGVTKDAPAEAKAFYDYVLSEAGQEKFASWGYRPVNETVLAANKEQFPTPSGLFTIDKFGGWEKTDAELFDPENGKIAKIEEDAGVSTAK